MKRFLTQYWVRIVYWTIFLVVLFYFAPKQNDFYLDDDIAKFKHDHLRPALIWLWVIIGVIFLVILFLKSISLKDSLIKLFYISCVTAALLFIFQDLFLAGALFLNTQIKKDSSSKNYVVEYLGTEEKGNFHLYEPSTKKITIERKLEKSFYAPGLKQNETIAIQFNEGVLGIKYPENLQSNKY